VTEAAFRRRDDYPEERAQTLIGGVLGEGAQASPIRDPYQGGVVGYAPRGSAAEVTEAVAAARAAASAAAQVPALRRAGWLHRAAELLDERAASIAELMSRETGKALKDALGEVKRSKDTLSLSAEEAIRIEGEHVPLDGSEMGAGKLAMLLRYPVGVVGAITPFNAPFNLAAHKIAPALAAGNTIVLKAPPQAALVVHRLVRLFHDAGAPAGFVNLVYGGAAEGEALVRDPRVDFITFTGSSRVGEAITRHAGLRRVALELGGNGPTIVHEDADVAVAAPTCARNAVRLAGQSCISVQNVYVHRSLFGAMEEGMAATMRSLVVADPLDPRTDVGTLIDEAAAVRVEAWIHEARAAGARVVTGGERRGAQVAPTLLVDVQPSMRVVCDEVFGPVANLIAYDRLDEAIAAVNASPYGLQCGIYTRSNEVTFRAIREIRSGGLVVNGTSTWRTDQLAYGGVKASGIGREGPRYAIRDMTEQRLVVFNL
jgi:acyl-CoA reductase-like NAD-dependent aldehyde dehydrogenase